MPSLCTQISFSNQKQIGGKNRFGRDDTYPDFLMEVSSKKKAPGLDALLNSHPACSVI